MAKRTRPDPSTAAPLPEDTPSGWYADPLGEKRSRYWSFGWSASVSDAEPKPVPPPGRALQSSARQKSIQGLPCTGLGGYGWGVVPGHPYLLDHDESGISLLDRTDGALCHRAAYRDLVKVEIGGPGVQTSGGGFSGGGFGAEAAAEGMVVASVLNALTSKTTVETLISICGVDGEAFLVHQVHAPLALRVKLSEVFVRTRVARSADSGVSSATLNEPEEATTS